MITQQVRGLLADLQVRISSGDLSSGLGLARLYGNTAWYNFVERYGASEIEDDLFGRLRSMAPGGVYQMPKRKNGKVLHVLTQAWPAAGGHTRVVERLVGVKGDFPTQDVVVTEYCDQSVAQSLDRSGVAVRVIAARGLAAVGELAELMSSYSHAVLHINPDDIVATLSARLARPSGVRVGFYNHADHCFSFGRDAGDVTFEISAYGYALSKSASHVARQSFAGIPIDGERAAKPASDAAPYILSSGLQYKFDFSKGGIFAQLLECLIPRIRHTVRIVGPSRLPPNASPVLAQFQEQGRLVITPPIAHGRYIELLRGAHCYIDSAPITGGSAFPEACLRGVPCAGLVGPSMGYSPVDSVRSRSVEELTDRVTAILAGGFERSRREEEVALAVHKPDRVLARMLSVLDGGAAYELPFAVGTDALDVECFRKAWLREGRFHFSFPRYRRLTVGDRAVVAYLLGKHGLWGDIVRQRVGRLKSLVARSSGMVHDRALAAAERIRELRR